MEPDVKEQPFPARAGMNRRNTHSMRRFPTVPRTRGDRPALAGKPLDSKLLGYPASLRSGDEWKQARNLSHSPPSIRSKGL